jgi:L,D-transpeptidase catalytic domain
MMDREQLARALERLEPRDREVLELSLRRRVPDEDLATVFGIPPAEVARRRAGAIERLSDEIGVRRGEDLGHMLKALLEPATWEYVSRDSVKRAGPPQPPAVQPPPMSPPPRPGGHLPPGAATPGATPPGVAAPRATPPAFGRAGSIDAARREPVLGMRPGPAEAEPLDISRRGRRLLTAAAVAVALLVPAGVVAALTSVSSDEGNAGATRLTRPFQPERQAIGDPFPSEPKTVDRFPVAILGARTALRDRPGGRVKVRVRGRTEWGSPRVLAVVRREGDWLAVLVPELENGDSGWVRDDQVSRLDTVSWSLHVDRSRRRLAVKRDGKIMRRMRIGVGRSNHPTPAGRFAVTDKLRVSSPNSPYGCCVLALTGHQTRLPAGWPGGDRLAVHATRDRTSLGRAVSLGCMRTAPRDARWMMKRIPLGAPVFVRR